MEAVPATSGVRRTVRLAAALVVGQVLLVAIVGWVTLTRAGDHTAPTARGVDQLAAPPGLIAPAPPVPAPPGSPTSPAPNGSSDPAGNDGSAGNGGSTGNGGSAGDGNDGSAAGGRARDTDQQAVPPARKSRIGPAVAASPPGTSSGPLSLTPPTLIPPTTAPTLLTGAPPTAATPPPISPAATPSPSAGTTPAPVLAGRPCDRLGALARADDGRMVRCFLARDNQLRWKIV